MAEKYRKRPVIIEAMQFNESSANAVLAFINEGQPIPIAVWAVADKIIIRTLEGNMTATLGDYIIKGVNGEFYPCKPDIFEKTYEKIK